MPLVGNFFLLVLLSGCGSANLTGSWSGECGFEDYSMLLDLDLTQSGDVLVLCLCHTRELAFQIQNEYDRFSKYMPDVRTSTPDPLQCCCYSATPDRPDWTPPTN